MVYCTYDMLNMFRKLLRPSSGARDYMCVFVAYGVWCLVACCQGSGAGQQAMRPERGMLQVQHPSSTLRTIHHIHKYNIRKYCIILQCLGDVHPTGLEVCTFFSAKIKLSTSDYETHYNTQK